MQIAFLFALLTLNLIVSGQEDHKTIPFSEWKDKRLPIQDWVTIYGDTIKQSTLENKVCFFNFFNRGCPPCVQEVRYLNDLLKHYAEANDVVIIGFYSGTKENYLQYLKANKMETSASSNSSLKLNYSLVTVPKYMIVAMDPYIFQYKYNVWGIPSNLVMDKQGIVRYCSQGFHIDRSIQEKIYSSYGSEIDKLRQ